MGGDSKQKQLHVFEELKGQCGETRRQGSLEVRTSSCRACGPLKKCTFFLRAIC